MKKRIFTAIDISDEARQKVSDYIESLRCEFPDLHVGWEKTEKLHLTLKFFGDVDEIGLRNIEMAVKETARQISDFRLSIYLTGVFPNMRNAKILWLDLKDERNLLKLTNETLENECAKFGFAEEQRNFKPHLTIARIREPQKSKMLTKTHLESDFSPVEFDAKSIAVYESTLLPSGSIYQKRSEFKL